LNPVENIRGAAKLLILVFPVENERHRSVYPAHEVARLRGNIVKDTLPSRLSKLSHQLDSDAGFSFKAVFH